MHFSQILKFKKLNPAAQLPTHGSDQAAGLDLYSVDDVMIVPGEIKLVSTGLAMALHEGWEGQIRPRSGLAAKYGITVLNAPGTVDSDYRGEIKVMLINHGQIAYSIHPGDRIAQLVVAAVSFCEPEEVADLDETDRGTGGFGSTGK